MKKALILILSLAVFPACLNAQDSMEVRVAATERYADTFDWLDVQSEEFNRWRDKQDP